MNPSRQRHASISAAAVHFVAALGIAVTLVSQVGSPDAAYAGATLVPDALYHVGRCGDSPSSPPCEWSCTQRKADDASCPNQSDPSCSPTNPNCTDPGQACALTKGQIITSLTARLAVTVDDDTCIGGPAPHTRMSLRVKPQGGVDFAIPDRLLNLCNVSALCGPCVGAPASSCTQADQSCPLDPVFLCGSNSALWDELFIQNQGGIGLNAWLNNYQVIPPTMTADIVAQLPSLPADAVPVVVGAHEIVSAAVDAGPFDAATGPSKREYCVELWVITPPDAARTTLLDPPGTSAASSLADMGPCGCGDGVVGATEECDDANTVSGDGCDASCRREPCWSCSGEPSFCNPDLPRSQCRHSTVPGKSLLKISDKSKNKADSLKWKWTKGEATADFGDPLTADTYDLCLYHDSGSQPLLAGLRVPAGGTCDGKPCWSAKGSGGFKYKNKSGTPNGLTKLLLKAGAEGKVKIGAQAKGEALTLPALPLPLPALVQLQRIGQPDCWEARFSAAETNDAAKVQASSD